MFKAFVPKEISWLSFNERVLQEAADTSVPLINRIKFLGIYSSNLDEFFEVRVATLKRLCSLGKKSLRFIDNDPKIVLAEVQKKVLNMHKLYDQIYADLQKELAGKNIYFVNEKELSREQELFVEDYFHSYVRPQIFPIMIDNRFKIPRLEDRAIYLVVKLNKKNKSDKIKYSVIEIPSKILPRFIILPKIRRKNYIIFLDDIIRYNLDKIYSVTGYDSYESYDIKLTRDAELDIDDDISTSYMDKIHQSLKKRKVGNPVRLGYDSSMPDEMLDFILRKVKLKKDDTIIPGGRYHNFRDFIDFPDIIPEKKTEKKNPIRHIAFNGSTSIVSVIQKKDVVLNFPYHSFDYIIDLLREASIDPKVKSIKITLYRVAKFSSVINALINAVKNRKEVVVLLELQARFDEQNNLYWANKLKEEGVAVIFGISGLKVHSKLCMIERLKKNSEPEILSIIGTGNYNEDTAKLYTDTYLLTSHKAIGKEVSKLFDFFVKNYKVPKFKHLVVSPFSTRDIFEKLIQNEIQNAKEGKTAYIDWKLNNFSDQDFTKLLYEASNAGVKIRLMVRSMFSIIPGVNGMSENIEARAIVDKYLEHSRMYFFCNGGDEICYISSSDFLPRNLNSRIEVSVPIYDEHNQKELRDIFEIYWRDNVKSRILDKEMKNIYYDGVDDKKERIRSQEKVYEYLYKKNSCD